MGTKERIEILNKSDSVINELLEKVSNLEFEVEKLEKNEHYKYINGQAYFRQDYVLGREKEIERLNNIINKAYNETKKQNDEADYQEETDLSIILDILKGSDKEWKNI